MMSRMALSRPPGVSISSMTSRLPLRCADSSPCTTYRDVAGPIGPLISSTTAAEAVIGAPRSATSGAPRTNDATPTIAIRAAEVASARRARSGEALIIVHPTLR